MTLTKILGLIVCFVVLKKIQCHLFGHTWYNKHGSRSNTCQNCRKIRKRCGK